MSRGGLCRYHRCTVTDPRPSAGLLALAWPLVLTQLATVALSTTDTVMMGSLSVTDLAGGGLAVVLFNQVRTMGLGLVTSLGNEIAAAIGAAEHQGRNADDEVRQVTRAGFAIATGAGVAGAGLLCLLAGLLPWFGQSPEVVSAARVMTWLLAPGLVPCLWFLTLRQFTVGMRRPQHLLAVTLVSILVNIVLNLALMDGWGPLPALGLAGIGAATSLVHLGTAAALWAMARADPELRSRLALDFWRAGRPELRTLLRHGTPISLTYGSEAGLFTVLAMVAGSFGAASLAAHAIVNQITYIVFQVSVGLSHGVSILVSRAMSLTEPAAARGLALRALATGWSVVAVVGVGYLVVPRWLILPFATGADESAIALAAVLLLVAGITQFADSAQNLGVGLLRGVHLTGAGLRISLVGYWLIGLPAALLFAHVAQLGVIGCWIGLGIGLTATAAGMWRRFWRATRTGC